MSVRFVSARIHLPIDSCNKNVKTSALIAIEVSVKIWDRGKGTYVLPSAFESVVPHGRYIPGNQHEWLPKLEDQGTLLVVLLS